MRTLRPGDPRAALSARRHGLRAASGLLLGSLLLAGCTQATPSPAPAPSSAAPSSAADTSASPTPEPTPQPSAQPSYPPGDVQTDLEVPWGLARMPDGSLLVTQRNSGEVTREAVGKSSSLGKVPDVVAEGEGGLLGIAVDPTDETTVFVYHSSISDNRVVRMKLDGNRLRLDKVIVEGIPRAFIHNGGKLAFGPDGFLYIGTGDGNNSANAQNPDSLGGKILRVDREGNPAPNNPRRTRMWTLGHRNVQGFTWDDSGAMYASEFGQDTWDELNRIEPGKNYGWPRVEGMGNDKAYTNPLHVWKTDDASPSGIAYLNGNIYMASLKGESLWRIPLAGGEPERLLQGTYGRLRNVEPTGDGSLFLVTSNTFRGTPRPGDDRVLVWHP